MDWGHLRGVVASGIIFSFLAARPGCAWADGIDLLSRETISASADVRLVGADGERSWLDEGLGKARFGSAEDGGFRLRPQGVEATLAWLPRFSWSLAGVAVGVAQHGQHHAIGLSEAFLQFKPMTGGPVRISARAGLFWPPVSLEHSGLEWTVTDTVTPSAINSWIGEEVKVGGVEGTASVPLGEGRIALTAAAFGLNDTAGTLIAFRGWALHDQKAVAFGKQPLPALNGFMTQAQRASTHPVIEIDDRVGYYARLSWSPSAPVRFEALHYDNRGDPEAVTRLREWGWRTRFDSVGAVAEVGRDLTVKAMQGRTEMGYPRHGKIWVDTRFRAAYLLATQKFGENSFSGRIEAFGTRNSGSRLTREDDEDGWSATLAARHPIGEHVNTLIELQHVRSRREARLRDGLSPRQDQTLVQVALRLHL
jgi:hypothetical protein